VTLAGADADNLVRHAATDHGPRLNIFAGGNYPSAIDLPIIAAGKSAP